jgi:S1-C subfamily serine protease
MHRWLILPVLFAILVSVHSASPAGAQEKAEKKGYFGVQIAKDQTIDAVAILAVFDNGPAAKAGLRPGDLLLKVGDLKADNLKATVEYIRSLKPNQKVKVRFKRDNQEKEVEVTVGASD